MKHLTIAFALLVFGLPVARADEAVETYTVQTIMDGEPVIQMIQVFPENLLEHPQILKQIRTLGLDHIAYFSEEAEAAERNPSAEGDDELLQQKLKETGVPFEEVRAKKGFLAHMRSLWRDSFPKVDPNDPTSLKLRRSARQFGIISVLGKWGTLAFMIATDARKYSVYDWLPMAMVQGIGTYILNRYPTGIGKLLEKSWVKANAKSSAAAFYVKRLAYIAILTEFYKLGEVKLDLFTWSVQATVLANSAIAGLGEGWLSNLVIRKYQPGSTLSSAESRKRIDLMNFWLGSVSGVLAGMDLQKLSWIPSITHIGSYDFRLSGALLIAYYGTLIYTMAKNPEGLYSVVRHTNDFFGSLTKSVSQPVKIWFQEAVTSCKRLFHRQSNP